MIVKATIVLTVLAAGLFILSLQTHIRAVLAPVLLGLTGYGVFVSLKMAEVFL